MSEGDVSLIRDEDLLRRMWQQTEDFSRKKEIRAHMYRLREERLRKLYSPEPTIDGKGCEFSSTQGHLRSFADQNFQSMKSKEVRDAASPPKDFVYRGQDLKELSNAGWNVESENRTTDDGHTHVRSVQANIEGNYDVEGGRGQFGAIDQHKQSVTEYKDDHSSLKKKETASHTAAHEQVTQRTDDGTHISSTTSSSRATSKFQQVSSTKHEPVMYVTNNNDYDISQQTCNINNNVEKTARFTKTSDYDQTVKTSDYEQAELIARKVEYPDDNTKVVVETRCLPDGTRVTSTRREFRAPVVQTSQSEEYSKDIRRENKTFTTSTEKHSDVKQTSTNTSNKTVDEYNQDTKDSFKYNESNLNENYHIDRRTHGNHPQKTANHQNTKRSQHFEQRTYDIVDSQRSVDVNDFKSFLQDDTASDITTDTYTIKDGEIINAQVDKTSLLKNNFSSNTEKNTFQSHKSEFNTNDQQQIITTSNEKITAPSFHDKTINDVNLKTKIDNHSEKSKNQIERTRITTENNRSEEIIEKKTTSDQYKNNYTQTKISTDWSPSHQAWASTLRADTPPKENISTRASSPGSRTIQSSTSSLRSSVSPEKSLRKPGSRGTSPTQTVRTSPSRNIKRYTSPDKKYPHDTSPSRARTTPDKTRSSESRDQRIREYRPDTTKPSPSPERKAHANFSGVSPDEKPPSGKSVSPSRANYSPEKQPKEKSPVMTGSSEKTPGYMRPTASQSPSSPRTSPIRSDTRSPDRRTMRTTVLSTTEQNHNRFVDEETKVYKKTTEYIRPAASQTPSRPRTSPTRFDTRSPDRHTMETSMLSKSEKDYYQFVDEETKVNEKSPGYMPPSASQTPNSPRTFPTGSDTRSPDRHTVNASVLLKTEADHNRSPTTSQRPRSPRISPTRSDTRSPDKHIVKTSMLSKTEKDHNRSPATSQTPRSPRNSPTRSDTRSPDRVTTKTSMLSKTEEDYNRLVEEETKVNKKTPAYMPPFASQTPNRTRTSPTRSHTRSPDRHTMDTSMLSKSEKDHYRFVDEETKVYKNAPGHMPLSPSQISSSPRTSPIRSDTRSPDRHTVKTSILSKTENDHSRSPTTSQTTHSPRNSPTRSDTRSPDRHTMDTSMLSKSEKDHYRFVDEETKVYKKTPGHMPPSPSQISSSPRTSPTRSDTRSPDRHTVKTSILSKTENDHNRSPTTSQTPHSPRNSPTRSDTRSPDRHTTDTSILSKREKDHYRFVDEETKVYKKTPGHMPPSPSQISSSPRTSPTRSDTRSPDRLTMKTSVLSKTEEDYNRFVDKETKGYKKTPGYMRPTASQSPCSPSTSPVRSDTRSPDRHTIETSMLLQTEKHDNRILDEETKVSKKTPGYMRPTASQSLSSPRTSPIRSDTRSPDRHTMDTSMLSKTEKHNNRILDKETNVYKRTPGYMRPTASQTPSSPRTSPTRSDTRSPDRNTMETSMLSKTDDRFEDEKMEIYEQSDNYCTSKKDSYHNINNYSKYSTLKDTPDSSKQSNLKTERSPSPPKGPVTFISQQEFSVVCSNKLQTRKKDSEDINITNVIKGHEKPKYENSPEKFDSPSRDTYSSTYGTYDKEERKYNAVKKETSTRIEDFKGEECNTSIRREKTPTKFSHTTDSSTKKPPKETSPAKSSTKSIHTSDFINNEQKNEEINKRTTRPRQLITPSTSPTRKPTTAEKAPSTGQSSPTTSVSGFVYFRSPRPDDKPSSGEHDLNPDWYLESKTNDSITTDYNMEKESTSTLPCKSSKQTSPTKESLPRKSSLKKPSDNVVPLSSPIEKPPTNFRVSPTEPEHHVIKKDQPGLPSEVKPKPPLERRETYEERCRKILGMMEDEKTLNKISHDTEKYTHVQKHSPSISPRGSPDFNEELSPVHPSKLTNKEPNKPKEEIRINTQKQEKQKILSRDNSPTKLQDILSRPKYDAKVENIAIETINTSQDTSKTESIKRSPLSPVRKLREPSPIKLSGGTGKASPRFEDNALPSTKTPKSDIQYKLQEKNDKDEASSQSHTSKSVTTTKRHKNFADTTPYKTDQPGDTDKRTPCRTPSPIKSASKYLKEKPQVLGHSRTPSPTKSVTKVVNISGKEHQYLKQGDQKQLHDIQKDVKLSRKSQQTHTVIESTASEKQHSRKEIIMQSENKYSNTDINEKSDKQVSVRSSSPSKDIKTNNKLKKEHKDYATRRVPHDQYVKSERSVPSRSPSPRKSKDNIDNNTKQIPNSPQKKSTEPLQTRSSSPIKSITSITTAKTTENNISKQKKQSQKSTTLTESGKTNKPRAFSQTTPLKPPSKVEKVKEIKSRSPSPVKNISNIQIQQPSQYQNTCYPVEHYDTNTMKKKETNESKITKYDTEFIKMEDQEALNKIQTHSREVSSDRSDSSSIDEVLSDVLDDVENSSVDIIKTIDLANAQLQTSYTNYYTGDDTKTKILIEERPRNKPLSNLPSQNISPTKKITTIINKTTKSPEPTNSRNLSPKKLTFPIERPQSPQVPKPGIPKIKESTLTRKTISQSKVDTTSMSEDRKTSDQQSSIIKISTNKNIRSPHKPLTKEHARKETEIKTSRTTSDISKKPISLKTRSKPEIQVSDVTSKFSKKSTIINKTTLREPQTKLATKPKSATALNTSIDENDVIVDVQQAKSSRENSPDRICPTPVNIQDDVGTPRFPDEVSEPDDEFRRRANHIIHETETIVDDIVEISEDDELFVKRSTEDENRSNESFLNETDNVTRLTNKINSVDKPSRYIADDLKSDECLLSVSEKVTKFAKGPYDKRDAKSPSRKIFDDFDKNTVYQDDYTKLSVNDKAHLFIETAEKAKTTKIKPTQKAERPDFSNVDETLKTDNCLLSVSDKVNKFVKSAENFFTDSQEITEKEKNIKEKHEIIMKSIIQDSDNEFSETENEHYIPEDNSAKKSKKQLDQKVTRTEIKLASPLKKDHSSPKHETNAKTTSAKITTLRSSEAVKKAKALFENIGSTTQTTKDSCHKTTKLTDIGVVKKIPLTDSRKVHHPSAEGGVTEITDIDSEVDFSHSISENYPRPRSTTRYSSETLTNTDKRRNSPPRSMPQNSETPRSGTPSQCIRTTSSTSTKTVLSRYPHAQRPGTQKQPQLPTEKSTKPQDIVPGYLKPTKTSQIREEIQQEETEVSNRRGSEKFCIELRRTSVDRTSVSSERRHSVEHHQPCIEDIFDVDLLEHMLEKVVGYEQRRRIRTQIRVAKKKYESEQRDGSPTVKTIKHTFVKTPKNRSPERQPKSIPQKSLSPERLAKTKLQNTRSPERHLPEDEGKPVTNGHAKEPTKSTDKLLRPQSPEKRVNSISKTKSPIRHTSPEKKSVIFSSTPKIKTNRFDEYASAYIKKVGLNESDNLRLASDKIQNSTVHDDKKIRREIKEHKISKTESLVLSKTRTDRSPSKDNTEVVQRNGKRTPSPDKRRSPERRPETSTEKKRSPSPDHKQPRDHKKETMIKTSYDKGKQTQPNQVLEEKPSWVTNRNLKKITSETRTTSSKKIESEKPKYRASSPSKVISKPIDVITSSYGPGPLDADGRPLFGIKALRKGATNFQVKGTVIRQEYHSTNGGEPEGTVSVTAYSSQPEELERLLAVQGERPSRLHGLAAITTTKKFGGTTGTTLSEVHSKEDSATLQQFTQSDRRVTGSRVEEATECRRHSPLQSEVLDNTTDRQSIDKSSVRTERGQKRVVQSREEDVTKMEKRIEKREQNVRQSSVKSLTEKFIKNASESTRSERSSYPKAGLILRSTSKRDSVSSDSSAPAGLARTDSEQSLASDGEESTVVTTTQDADGRRVTTRTTTRHHTHTQGATQEKSFLDSTTKVTGVQDILTRMKNADIVIEKGDSTEDAEARALLNKFLGASVLMAGMRSYVVEPPARNVIVNKESVRSSGKTHTQRSVQELDLDQCWDERLLKKLLEESTDYEQRRLLRARIRTLMAEQEACAAAVSEAASCAEEQQEQPAGESSTADSGDADVREEQITITSSVRRNSSEKTVSSSTTTKTSKVIESVRTAPKPVSPFTKFRQLEKQNSTNTPNSPTSPQPASPGSRAPLFRFTDPALQASAATIKERLLQWCRDKTRDYENVKLENFSSSWADGLAFCALVHHFVPDAFDYSKLTPDKRRHNFTLAFKVADEKAGIYPLLDVEDMVETRRPDWKCVFTYVQAIHRRFRDQP